MTPERYQLIDQIFQTAIELDPVQLPAFLDEACSGDGTLRREVESLLTSDSGGLSFIDDAAVDVAARLLASDEPELAVGEHVDRYEILSLLGSGGMGEVYLARDEKLKRNIALKLLPHYLTTDPESLQRFQQEAHAASALNHPNIITIHEIGEAEGRHFIATEFVDGHTVRQRLKQSELSLDEALDIAIQVCSALSAAHKAGIVHRDIKPENIMLRRDGYVKVLDFGLAKLTEERDRNMDLADDEQLDLSSGLVMGTIKYMSPEQAQGLAADHRSDVFSLGVVIYEMVTGRAPFVAEDNRDLVKQIITNEPPPLRTFLRDVPEEVQRIVSRTLHKEKTDRYQSADELLADFKKLKEKGNSFFARASIQIRQHKSAAGIALIACVLLAVITGVGAYRLLRPRHARFETISMSKLTNFGDASNASISPDGQYVVYVKGWGTEGPGKFSLWRKAIEGGSEFQLVPPTEIDGWGGRTKFSPDGKSVLYTVRLRGQPAAIYSVPLLGGESKKVSDKYLSPASLSPDGKHYVVIRPDEGKWVVLVANADGTGEREIFTRQDPSYYRGIMRWSPDGKLIAGVAQNGDEGFPRVVEFNLEARTERPITSQKWTAIRDLAWLPDMSGLLLTAAEETSSIYHIWQISYPSGEARRVTNDTVSYFNLDISADGQTVLAERVEMPTSFWVMPVEGKRLLTAGNLLSTADARQINTTTISSGENLGLVWTPDGRIVYVSEESGNADIWSMNAEGGDRKQLTSDPHRDVTPDVSPDGRNIAFLSTRSGAENIWIMNVDGSNQRRLTGESIERNPIFSSDSKWLYFVSGKGTVSRVSVEGGEPEQVVTEKSYLPLVSPDGKSLAYQAPPGKILITPITGGQAPTKTFEATGNQYQWTPNGSALTFICTRCESRPNWPDIWVQPLDGAPAHQLTNFRLTYIFMYAWSRDGTQLALASRQGMSDLVLIKDLQ